MAEGKPHMNLIFIGHVDSGKSTTVGRLLYETGSFSEQDKAKIEKELATLGKVEFEFAYFLDTSGEERKNGENDNPADSEVLAPVCHANGKGEESYQSVL